MPHRITCYSRAYFTNIPNHKIVYAVKNIVKEGPICQNVEKIFTSARMGAGRDGISGATRPPAGLSMAMFMPAVIGSAVQNGKDAWTLVRKRR